MTRPNLQHAAQHLTQAVREDTGIPDFIRGFIDGYFGRTYDTGFGVRHSFVVCLPTDPYRRGFLTGQASRYSDN